MSAFELARPDSSAVTLRRDVMAPRNLCDFRIPRSLKAAYDRGTEQFRSTIGRLFAPLYFQYEVWSGEARPCLTTASHNAESAEAQDHHCPSGWLGDGVGKGHRVWCEIEAVAEAKVSIAT